MSLYLENGYLNFAYVMSFPCPYIIIIGGRGTGKTYSALKYAWEHDIKMILMRRTQSQTDLINKPEFSPINPIARDCGFKCEVKPISKYNSSIVIDEEKLLGYTAALSTFSNIRGFDSSIVDWILFDEAIPEVHERPIKAEGECFLNVCESVGRNREIQGRKPLKVILLSNANRLDSPILEVLGLVNVIDRMRRKGQEEYIHPARGVAVFLLNDSPISAKKAGTTLYQIAGEGRFASMALGNDFAFDDLSEVKSLPLAGWKLLAQLGRYYIYKRSDQFYISRHCAGTPKRVYQDTDIDKMRFVRENPSCLDKILTHKIYYEDFSCKSYLTSLYI